MRNSKSGPRFFNHALETLQQLSPKNIDTVHFRHNGLLAFSALIIDYFMTAPSRKLNPSAELLLGNLDLLKAYPHYPVPQATPQNFLTSANYLHQLCLAATNPTLLLWLTRSISLALKRLSLEEIILNYHDYAFIYGPNIDIHRLQSQDPNQFNRYVGLPLRRILAFDFIQGETCDNKTLPRISYSSKSKTSTTGLVAHWEKGNCLISAIVDRSEAFKPIMSDEHCSFLYRELQHYKPALPTNHKASSSKIYLERYTMAKQHLSHLQFSLSDLEKLYFEALDTLIEAEHNQPHLFPSLNLIQFGDKRYFKSSDADFPHYHASKSFSTRLYEELQDALCRLIALEIIPNTVFLNQPSLSNDGQYKTFLTQ